VNIQSATAMWDQLLVFLIIGLAALYLARGFFGKKKGGCGGCANAGCAKPTPEPPAQLVQLDAAPPRRDRPMP